jgi:hypothetical protein
MWSGVSFAEVMPFDLYRMYANAEDVVLTKCIDARPDEEEPLEIIYCFDAETEFGPLRVIQHDPRVVPEAQAFEKGGEYVIGLRRNPRRAGEWLIPGMLSVREGKAFLPGRWKVFKDRTDQSYEASGWTDVKDLLYTHEQKLSEILPHAQSSENLK